MRSFDDSLTDSERRILSDIDENGLHVVQVEDEQGEPEYAFSVGMWHSFEQAEVVVFGLPAEAAEALLEAIADDAAEGKTFVADSRHEGLLQGYPVRFLAVPKAAYAEHFPEALWAYEQAEFPMLQLVWPDKQGRWPWEAGVREGFRDAQPLLGVLPGK
jgi:hypothetical protein